MSASASNINLFSETRGALGFTARAVVHFLKVRPLTTATVIGLGAISQAMAVVAMLLPLKVVLLAASDGIPKYFAFFMEPEDKPDWILILAFSAVVSFLLTLLIDKVAKDLADSASMEVLEGANELATVGKEREKAKRFYFQFCNGVSAYLFCGFIFILIGLLDPRLVATVLAVLALQYLVVGFYLNWVDTFNPGRLFRFIDSQPGPFLNILSSVTFLVAFFVILYPILMGESINILVALVSVIALRRAFGALTTAVGTTTRLYRKRHIISPLVFKSRKVEAHETGEARAFREVFGKKGREKMVSDALKEAWGCEIEAEVFWQDPPVPQINTFLVRTDASPGGNRRLLQKRVFAERFQHFLETEELLFSHLSRTSLMAPEVVAQFTKGRFLCQLCDFGTGVSPSGKEWKTMFPEIMGHLWELKPPKALISAFDSSHPRMERRLSEEMVNRVEVAVDDDEEAATLRSFLERLPEVRKLIKDMPLFVANPDLNRTNVVLTESGDSLVMLWYRWRIQPVGAEIPPAIDREMIEEMVDRVSRKRSGRKQGVTVADVDIVNQCSLMEKNIHKGNYKEAIERMAAVLSILG